MQNNIIQLIEAIFQMLMSMRMNQQGVSQDGLGLGGLGLSSELIKRMFMSKEAQQAYKELAWNGNDRGLVPESQKGLTTLSESDYKGWNNEIDKKMTASLKELGLDDAAIAQFKDRTKEMALQLESLALRYSDPIERNMAVTDFIDKQVNNVRKAVRGGHGRETGHVQRCGTFQRGICLDARERD